MKASRRRRVILVLLGIGLLLGLVGWWRLDRKPVLRVTSFTVARGQRCALFEVTNGTGHDFSWSGTDTDSEVFIRVKLESGWDARPSQVAWAVEPGDAEAPSFPTRRPWPVKIPAGASERWLVPLPSELGAVGRPLRMGIRLWRQPGKVARFLDAKLPRQMPHSVVLPQAVAVWSDEVTP